MKMKKILMPVLTVGMIFSLISCAKKVEEKKEIVRPVKMMTISTTKKSKGNSYPGKVKASKDAELSFVVPGRITKLPVLRGQFMKKGDLVAQLDQRDFVANLKAAQADYDFAKSQFDSFKKLVEQGVISQDEFNQKKKNLDVTSAAVRSAEKALEDTTLRAPFDGQIAEKYVDIHQDVKANQKVVYFQDTSYLDILIDVPEADVAAARGNRTIDELSKKITADATFASITGKIFKVKLKEFDAIADKDTQTYKATLTMKKPTDVNIMPGMTATITVFHDGKRAEKNNILVPVNAVFADANGKSCVWLINPQTMTVTKRKIQTGEMRGGEFIVSSGLKNGDIIATSGIKALFEGTKVKEYKKFF